MNEYIILGWSNLFEISKRVGTDIEHLRVIWRQASNADFYCIFYRIPAEGEEWRMTDVHESISVEQAIRNIKELV